MKKILLIGDSIRLDYGKFLNSYLDSDIRVQGKAGEEEAYLDLDMAQGANGGDSGRVLDYLQKLAEEGGLIYDYVLFNCGLHDIKRTGIEEKLQVDEKTYQKNLREILHLLKKNHVVAIFINTTPVEDGRHDGGKFNRYAKDAILYNQIAGKVMEEYHVPELDLHGFTNSLGLSGNELYRDHVHFQENVIKLQAAYIAGAISMLIKK